MNLFDNTMRLADLDTWSPSSWGVNPAPIPQQYAPTVQQLGQGTTQGGVFTPNDPNPYINVIPVNPSSSGGLTPYTGEMPVLKQDTTVQGMSGEHTATPNVFPRTGEMPVLKQDNPIQGMSGTTTPQLAASGSNNSFGQGSNGYSAAGSNNSGFGTATSGGSNGVFPLQGQYGIVKMAKGGLPAIAKHLESQGRGNDSRLMHVSPRELQGLQALAKAKGGSLTINPQTGLPEAGFLEDVLPVAAAGALMFMAPPLAPAIGGAFGATGALATGIGAGLLAGGSSLLTQALSGQPVNVGKAATTGALTGLTAGLFAPSTAVQTPVPALESAASAPVVPTETVAPTITTPQVVSSGAQPVPLGANPTPAQYAAWDQYLGTNQTPGISDQTLFANEAARSSTSKPWTGNEKFLAGLGGITALSLLGSSNQPKIQTPATTSYIRPYTFSQTRNPNWGQPGQSYYTQGYTAQPIYKAAAGGVISNGPVETMSRQNMGKQLFPMSLTDGSAYATSSQMPISAEVVSSDYEPTTDPYTGEEKRMASGGSADSGYIPTSQAVQDYNKMLSERAAEEYLRNPMPAALMPVSQNQPLQPTSPLKLMPVDEPQISQDIKGLYQYYLGRQPSENEIGQWANQINGPVTPEMANYFQQFTGAELANTGYKPKGPNPFLGQAGLPGGAGYQNVSPIGMVGTLNADLVNRAVPSGAAQAGLPQYKFNPATNSYAAIPQQPMPIQQMPVAAPIQYDQYSGGAKGGLMPYDLGGYSDGGRLLKGPGDGMSDNIPATIANKQPARLADGEFVVPADVVSHLGNGSTDAGAKKLYAMMDKVRTARVGTKKQGKQIKAEKYLPT